MNKFTYRLISLAAVVILAIPVMAANAQGPQSGGPPTNKQQCKVNLKYLNSAIPKENKTFAKALAKLNKKLDAANKSVTTLTAEEAALSQQSNDLANTDTSNMDQTQVDDL